jgi:hypothetical protein
MLGGGGPWSWMDEWRTDIIALNFQVGSVGLLEVCFVFMSISPFSTQNDTARERESEFIGLTN